MRDGAHVLGHVAIRLDDGVYIEQQAGQRTLVRYIDVWAIRDLDTGLIAGPPVLTAVAPDTPWAKLAFTAAAVVGFIWMTRITGCFGHCNY